VRFIKFAVISFVAFFILLTLLSLIIPSHIRIARTVTVRADKDSVMHLIRDTTNWGQWHPGFTAGRQVPQLHVTPMQQNDTAVVMQVQYASQQPITNGWDVYTYPASDSLALQWYMDFDLAWYPWQKFSSFFLESKYGTVMQQGLQNIKAEAE
jgi:hypothetical protein